MDDNGDIQVRCQKCSMHELVVLYTDTRATGYRCIHCDHTVGEGTEKLECVDHPKHYNQHPAGIECIDVIEHFSLNLGNAMKYIWRAEFKGKQIEDLEKARWYIEREINRIKPKGDKDV